LHEQQALPSAAARPQITFKQTREGRETNLPRLPHMNPEPAEIFLRFSRVLGKTVWREDDCRYGLVTSKLADSSA
jgi:hypothetical protein